MRKVLAVQDQDSHWYVIPKELEQEFIGDDSELDEETFYRFDEKWGQYRTGGDLNLIQLYAEI
jgi:hypothetical protein